MRRKFYFVGVIALFLFFGVVPRVLNYQGKLVDSSGVGINDTLNVTFRLYAGEIGGSHLWEEEQTVVVRNGLFSVFLGNVVPFPDSVDFSVPYWLEIEIGDERMSPRERLVSAPYSLYAERAGSAPIVYSSAADTTRRRGRNIRFEAGPGATLTDEGGTINIILGRTDIPSLQEVLIEGNNAGTQQINMNNRKIINLADPTDNQDAATKHYVDSAIGSSSGGVTTLTAVAPLSASGSTGNVTLSIPPATSTTDGYLTAADWSRFNNKQDALGYVPAHSGANSDITALLGLVTPLNVTQGGTGLTSPGPAGNVLTSNGTEWISAPPAGGGLSGRGTPNYLPKFVAEGELGNSTIFEKDGNVGIGTDNPMVNFQVTQPTTGPGVVSNAANSNQIIGSGTYFNNTFKVGDQITIGYFTRTITQIQSNDTLIINSPIEAPHTNVSYSLVGGTRFVVLGNGNVGIGTSSPTAKLEIQGTLKIVDGTQGAKKVLTSDAEGLASWQNMGTPSGIIVMYSGPWNFDATGLGTGPLEGWALCNGNNGTPNLSDRFVMGTTSSGNLGSTGGANTYTLTVDQLPVHTHPISTDGSHTHTVGYANCYGSGTYSSTSYQYNYCGYSAYVGSSGSHNHGGTTGPTGSGMSIDNRPAYVALAFIMKL